ncbi:MAG: PilT/PilU family type 4a pilus ATPase [Methylococcales bacterium]|nr:PilT/PilU family type 4a pilus ATPase [Methylococcales bacterium]
MIEKNGDSLTFKTNASPFLNIAGQSKNIGKNLLDNKVIQKTIFTLISADEKQDLIKNKSLESTYIMEDKHHFHLKITIKGSTLEMIVSPKKPESKVLPEEAAVKSEEPDVKAEEPPEKTEDQEDEDGFLDLGMSASDEEEEEEKKPAEPEKESESYQVLGKAPEGKLDVLAYLKKMVEIDGSDLFLTVASKVKAKVSGTAIPLDNYLLTPEMTRSGTLGLMNDEQIEEFERTKDLDFAIAMPDGSARFRANAFYQRRTVGLVMRLIPSEIPTAEQLNLPPILTELIMAKRGLLLMVGGTGSGKSTTLAAMINHRNANSPGHILTIEDPVEFSHPNLMSIVNQREVGVDTASYAKALKASLREAPDVILIGEIRDEETMEAGLELANTGHLCISTMHANNANQAMERIVNMFPQSRHKQLFMDIAGNLNAVVSQRLVKTKTGGRCAAIENMINTPHIATLILKGELNEIKDAMATSGTKGMKTFDDALFDLFKSDKISLEEALVNADSRNDLEAKLNFG